MSLDAKIYIKAIDTRDEVVYAYESDAKRYNEFHEILNGSSEILADRLLGTLTEADIGYLNIGIPEHMIDKIGDIQPKDPARLLGLIKAVRTHYQDYTMGGFFKKDIEEGDDNWKLSLTKYNLRFITDISHLEGILEIAVIRSCKVVAYMLVF